MSAVLLPLRDDVVSTNFALVLVLVVVAVAAAGNRVAGIVAALSAGAWFDFFFTKPYATFAINDRADIETAVLLLLVGVGVTELAAWGRRQHAIAEREAGYLAGVEAASGIGATGGSSSTLIHQVAKQLTGTLGLRRCRFQYGVAGLGDLPRLGRDGHVRWRRVDVDIERAGLPTQDDVELLVESGGLLCGRFLLSATPGTRPSVAQRLMAVTLADQVGAALGRGGQPD